MACYYFDFLFYGLETFTPETYIDKEPRLAGPWLIGFLLEYMVEVPFPLLALSISSQILEDCFLSPLDL